MTIIQIEIFAIRSFYVSAPAPTPAPVPRDPPARRCARHTTMNPSPSVSAIATTGETKTRGGVG